MGSRVTATLRGFGRGDRRLDVANLDATSSFTERGGRPGVPSTTGKARVQVHGAQSEDLTARIQRQGYAGKDSASVGYFLDGETADDLRGYNPPNWPRNWTTIVGPDTNAYGVHDICTLPDSQRPVVLYGDETAQRWKTRTWSWASEAWASAVTVSSEASDMSSGGLLSPCALCPIAEDHLLALVVEGTGSSLWPEARIYRSSDQGATWDLHTSPAFSADFGFDSVTFAYRARMRYSPASRQMAVAVAYDSSGSEYLRLGASDDLGATWKFVDNLEVDTLRHFDLLVFPSGRFVLVHSDGSSNVYARAIGDAFESFADAVASEVVAGTYGQVAGFVDPDGIGWLYLQDSVNPEEINVLVTLDEGRTWELCGDAADTRDGNRYPDYSWSATSAMGMGLLAHCWADSSTSHDRNIGVAWLGGWSSRCTPYYPFGDGSTQLSTRLGGGSNLPLSLWPFTKLGGAALLSTTGSPTETLIADWRQLTGNVAATWTWNTSAGQRYTMDFNGIAADVAGGQFMKLWIETTAVGIWVRITETGFQLYDGDSSSIGSVISYDMTEPWVFQLTLFGTSYEVLYKRPWETLWNEAGTGTVSVSTAGTGRFGWSVTGGTYDLSFGLIQLDQHSPATGSQFDWRDGTDVPGRPLGALPFPIPDAGDVDSVAARLSLRGGAAAPGETITIPAGYAYPIEHLGPWVDRDPDVLWASASDASEVTIAWAMPNGVSSLGSPSVAVLFHNVNFPTAYFEGWNGSTWDTILTYNGATDFSSLTSSASGDTITPASGTSAASRYIQQHELVGGYYAESGGEVHRIEACEGGVWAGSGNTTKKAELRVTDGDSGGAPAGGSCALWARSGVVVAHDVGAYSKYRIRIPATTTYEGYFKGKIIPMAFKAVGRQWGWNWTVDYATSVAERGNDRHAPVVEQLRRPARELVISNPDGYLLHHLRGSSASPGYVAADAGDPLAAVEDTPMLLAGLLHETRSGEDPILALLSVPNTDATITDPTLWVYGYIASSVSWENKQGHEGANEHVGLAAVTIRELTGAGT